MNKTKKRRSPGKRFYLHEGIILAVIIAAMILWALISDAFRITGDWIKGLGEFNIGTLFGIMHFITFGILIFLVLRWRKLRHKASRFDALRNDLSHSEEQHIESMSRMTAGVAHEINNPLAGIKNCMMLLRDAIPPDHKYSPYADMIDKEIERITEIVKKMLQLYHPMENGHKPEQLSVHDAVQDVITKLEEHVQRKKVRFRIDIPSDFPGIKIQEVSFQQILQNLLLNAIQASPVGGEIQVGADVNDNHFHIFIQDQGPGIPGKTLPHIFEPFFTTKIEEQEKGIGLGLSLSRSLAIFMGGRIMVETEPEKGSTFIVELPQEVTDIRKPD